MRRMLRRLRRSGFYRSFFNFFGWGFWFEWVFCVPDADGSNRPVRVASGQSGEVFWKIPAFVVYLVDALLVVFPSG